MRFLPFATFLLAACSQSPDPGDAFVGVYRGAERDGLCVAREGEALTAGLIAYGDGTTNCSLNGRAEARGNSLHLTPSGDSECSVEIQIADGVASVGPRSPACAYYCGPGADFAGRKLRKTPDASTKLPDFAGDPLC